MKSTASTKAGLLAGVLGFGLLAAMPAFAAKTELTLGAAAVDVGTLCLLYTSRGV